jgi:hypothetical protein
MPILFPSNPVTNQEVTVEGNVFIYDGYGWVKKSPSGDSNVVITNPSSGQVLVYNGTEWVNAANLVQGTAVTASGTAVDFTGIPSWAKRITILMADLSTSGGSMLQVQLGYGGTPTFVTSSYKGSSGQTGATGANTSLYTAGIGIDAASNGAGVRHGCLTVFRLGSSNTYVARGGAGRSDTAGSGTGSASVTLSDVLTAVRITTINGTDTFDSGTINIMYE